MLCSSGGNERAIGDRIVLKLHRNGIFLWMNFARDKSAGIDKGTNQFDLLNFNTVADEIAMQIRVRILVFQ